jgi:alpha-L-arabinofuranosidase
MNGLRLVRIAPLIALVAFCPAWSNAQTGAATLAIDPARIVHPVSPTLYGLMTEEINHSYEGGLYAEMVSNRTLRWSWSGAEGWMLVRRGSSAASMDDDKTTGPSAALANACA